MLELHTPFSSSSCLLRHYSPLLHLPQQLPNPILPLVNRHLPFIRAKIGTPDTFFKPLRSPPPASTQALLHQPTHGFPLPPQKIGKASHGLHPLPALLPSKLDYPTPLKVALDASATHTASRSRPSHFTAQLRKERLPFLHTGLIRSRSLD